MGRHRLFPERQESESDTRKPQERFEDFASKLLRVSKSEIDKREKDWRDDKR